MSWSDVDMLLAWITLLPPFPSPRGNSRMYQPSYLGMLVAWTVGDRARKEEELLLVNAHSVPYRGSNGYYSIRDIVIGCVR